MSNRAGWYVNPQDSTQYRYWDGKQWTDQISGDQSKNEPSEQKLESEGSEEPAPVDAKPSVSETDGSGSDTVVVPHSVKRVCRNCSTESITDQQSCPECGKAFISPPVYRSRGAQIAAAVVVVSAQAEEACQAAAEVAAEQERAAQLAAAQVTLRKANISGIEKSVTKMARGHARDGVIAGWPKNTRCTPKAGQNIENLNKSTTSFSCFVITQKNANGTSRGHYYDALMNRGTGRYTYGYAD